MNQILAAEEGRPSGESAKQQPCNCRSNQRCECPCGATIDQGGQWLQKLDKNFEQHAYDEKGRPEKRGVGMDDLSHSGDAMGYAIYKLAAIRQWKVGAGKSRSTQVW